MKRGNMLVGAALVAAIAGAARADWFVGEPYKMHFPQMPDPFGWDVNFTQPKVLADDWKCTETGPVSDVHFWFSFQHDVQVPIKSIHLSIHKDVPQDPNNPFSHPGELLWERDFGPDGFKVIQYGTGVQGWYDPNTGFFQKEDHFFYYQANIKEIQKPFIQELGTIYWLDVSVELATQGNIGWKTTKDHFNDDAVWGDFPDPKWQELRDPMTGESLDLAFVITPAPSSASLLALAGLAALRRRRA